MTEHSIARVTRLRIAALLVTALAAVAFAGCSGGSSKTIGGPNPTGGGGGSNRTPPAFTNPRPQILDAVQRSRRVHVSKVSARFNGDFGVERFALKADGRLDEERQVASVRVQADQGGKHLDTEVRIDRRTAYVKSAQLRDLLDGKTWAEVPSSDAVDLGLFDFHTNTLMDGALAFAGASKIQQRGVSRQLGATVRRYDAQTDLAHAMSALPSSDAAALQKAFHLTGPNQRVTGSVWVDADGYVRKYTLHGTVGGNMGRLDAEATMTDIGKRFSIDTPPASKVKRVDPSKLKDALGS